MRTPCDAVQTDTIGCAVVHKHTGTGTQHLGCLLLSGGCGRRKVLSVLFGFIKMNPTDCSALTVLKAGLVL